MSTTPVQSVDGGAFYGLKAAEPKQDMDMEMFLRLLTVQLLNQNPLEPMNDRDFFAQMAQLGQVNGMEQLRDSFNVAQSSSLIGKVVTAYRPGGAQIEGQSNLVTGVVRGVTVENGKQILVVQEQDGLVEVELDMVLEIAQAPPAADVGVDLASLNLIGRHVKAKISVEDGEGGFTQMDVEGRVTRIVWDEGERIFELTAEDGTVHRAKTYEIFEVSE